MHIISFSNSNSYIFMRFLPLRSKSMGREMFFIFFCSSFCLQHLRNKIVIVKIHFVFVSAQQRLVCGPSYSVPSSHLTTQKTSLTSHPNPDETQFHRCDPAKLPSSIPAYTVRPSSPFAKRKQRCVTV